ncbi:MAG: tetratricopeptide repeat protein [Verrucomicrobiales bacterium]
MKPEAGGELIGHYKLLKQIGEGGFGVVWMAEQLEPVRRRVALKIIKPGMDTKEVIARFEQERQALAMMDHANIAKVFDAGTTPAGRPFFVMELVRGVKITDYCDQANLPTAERLALFIAVCHAVQHAHQKGIIHRDIKPSNILVTLHDGVPVPKVIDFGVAKATQSRALTDLTFFTQFEQMIGTPLYMSPEQAEMSGLDIDTRSDLDWIVMKALEKDRTRRYESASGLALDLQRHLQNEPVLARPPSFGYKAGKFVRKYKRSVIAAAAVLLAVLAGLVTSTVLYLGKRDALANESVQRLKAEQHAQAEAAARLEAESIVTLLTTLFQSPNPERDGLTITVAESLDRAAEEVETKLDSQPARRAGLQTALGATYLALGLPRKAIPLLEKVREYKLATPDLEHPYALMAMRSLAISYAGADRKSEALNLHEEVLTLSRKLKGPAHPETLLALNNLAGSLREAERLDEAIKLIEEVLALSRTVNGPEHPDTLSMMSNLAVFYDAAGRRVEALPLLEEVLALNRKVNGPEHPDTISAMSNLASFYQENGRLDEALRLQEEALPLSRKVKGPEHADTLGAMQDLSNSYTDAKRGNEALTLREERLTLSRKVHGPEHPETLSAMVALASSHEDAGHRDETLKLREELLPLSRKVKGAEHRDTLGAMTNLALSYRNAHRFPEAEKLADDLLASLDESSHPREYAAALRLRGGVHVRVGRWKEAAGDYSRATVLNPDDRAIWYRLAPLLLQAGDSAGYRKHRLTLLEKFRATDNLLTMERTARTCLLLPVEGEELETAGKLADAAATLGHQHEDRRSFQSTAALAHYRRGRYGEAVSTLRDLLANRDYLTLEIDIHAVLAMALHRLGQPDEARAALAKASDLVATHLPSPDSGDFGGIDWSDILIARLLLREAKALLQIAD